MIEFLVDYSTILFVGKVYQVGILMHKNIS